MASTITTSLVLDTKNFNRNLDKVQARLNVFKGLGTAMARTMQYAVGGSLLIAGANALKAGVDFDLTLQKLKALAGPENARGVEKLAKTARHLGENSIYTASQVAEMQLSLKKLGLEVGTIDDMSESVLKFATAMDVDVNTAGTTVVNTMKKFTKSFQEFNGAQEKSVAISEQFVAATVNSALQFDTLRNSLNYAGAEANAAGFTFSETAAILGKLADAGFTGSRGGVILRKILQSLGKSSEDVRQSFTGLIEDNKSFNEVMKIVGVRAAGGTLALGGLTDEIVELARMIEDAEGNVDAFSDAVQGSFYGRMREVISALEEVGISFLDQFEKPIKRAISQLAEFIRTIDAEDVRKFGQALKVIAEVIIASNLIRIVGNLARNVKGLVGFFGEMATTRLGVKVAGELALIRNAAVAMTGPFGIALAFMAAGVGNFMDKLKKAKEQQRQMIQTNAGMVATVQAQAAAFAEVEELAPEEVYRRLKNGAIEAMQAFKNGELAADGNVIAETFVPEAVFTEIMDKANSLAGQFGTTFEEALSIAIKGFLPAPVKSAIDEAADAAAELIDRYGGTHGLTEEQFKLNAAANEYAEALRKIRQYELDNITNDSNFFGDEDGLNLQFIPDDEEFEEDITDIENWLTQLYARAEELQGVFIGVGNVIGTALNQAITGTRNFADAIKQALLGAIGALISKLTALAVAYGLAAVAKALFDGGSSISSAATAITKSGFGSFLTGNLGLSNLGAQTINVKTTGYVAGSDLVLTTGRGLNVNDRLYG